MRVSCSDCGAAVVVSSLRHHMEQSHGVILPHMQVVDMGRVGPTTYMFSFPRILKLVVFPVPGCPEIAHSIFRMQEHIMYIHFRSKVAVLQKWRNNLPRCDMWIMNIPAVNMIKRQRTSHCFKNTKMRKRRRDMEVTRWCLDI